jgi:hypothetical protein
VKAEDGAEKENVSLVGKIKYKKKDMNKVKLFSCHKNGHYSSQYPKKNKRNKDPNISISTEDVEFNEKFEKEFSLMTCISGSSSAKFGDIRAWFVDNGAS